MEDYEFELTYCPECGGEIYKRHGLFRTGIFFLCGQAGFCSGCGKEWHVIWQNSADFGEEGEKENV